MGKAEKDGRDEQAKPEGFGGGGREVEKMGMSLRMLQNRAPRLLLCFLFNDALHISYLSPDLSCQLAVDATSVIG